MYEILDRLGPDALVLDLGGGAGSFPHQDYLFRTILVDNQPDHLSGGGARVLAESAALPFGSRSFDFIVMNHVLEHVSPLKPSLQEIGRLVKRDGAIYIAVPDARTFSDRLYRKSFRNRGGHVNLFDSAQKLGAMVAWYSGLPHTGTTTLYSSFSFLNRRRTRLGRVRREMRVPGVPEPMLRWLTRWISFLDRHFNTRLSVYGWALYFGTKAAGGIEDGERNVCIRCGAARGEGERATKGRTYVCAGCGAKNASR